MLEKTLPFRKFIPIKRLTVKIEFLMSGVKSSKENQVRKNHLFPLAAKLRYQQHPLNLLKNSSLIWSKQTIALKSLENPQVSLQSIDCSVPGEFTFEKVSEGEYIIEGIPVNDWVTLPEYVKVTGLEDIKDLDLLYGKEINFSGIVIDIKSKPVEGAEILICINSLWTYSPILFDECVRRRIGKIIVTDKEGKFSGRAPRTYLSFIARKSGYAISRAVFQDDEKEITIRLDDEANVVGQVVDEKGNPAQDVFVAARFRDEFNMRRGDDSIGHFLTKTDSDGKFQLTGMSQNKYTLAVKDSINSCGAIKTVKTGRGKTSDVGTIVLEPFRKIRGVVMDKSGNSIENAKIISSESNDPTDSLPWFAAKKITSLFPYDDYSIDDASTQTTNANGNFVISILYDDDLYLTAEHEKYITWHSSAIKADTRNIEIVLQKINFINLHVHVFDGSTKEAAKNVKVSIKPGDSSSLLEESPDNNPKLDKYARSDSATTDENGYADLEIKAPGEWIIIAASKDKLSQVKKIRLSEGQKESVELFLEPAPSVVVKVISQENNQPIQGAEISLTKSSDSDKINLQDLLNVYYTKMKTDSEGKIHIPLIPKGKYRVNVQAFGFSSEYQKKIEIAADKRTIFPLP